MSFRSLALRAQRISTSAHQLQSHPGIYHSPGRVDSIQWIQLEWLATSAAAIAAICRARSARAPSIRNLTPPQTWTRDHTGSFQITRASH